VEYYSLKDQVKMKKYIETIHKMVKKSYENSEDHSEKGKQMELKEDIKTWMINLLFMSYHKDKTIR